MDLWTASILSATAGVTGVALGYLFAERRARAAAQSLHTSQALAQQRADSLAAQIESDKLEFQHRLEELHTRLSAQLTEKDRAASELQNRLLSTERQLAAVSVQFESNQQNLAEQKRLLDDAHGKLTAAFASVSLESLQKNNAAFLAMAETRFRTLSTQADGSLLERKAQIEGVLKPMHELLNQYQARLGEIEKGRNESYSALQKQIGEIAEVERTLKDQTGLLINAFNRPHVRGQWGEIALRKLVELAGMSSRCDFIEQASLGAIGDDGRQRPDMIVQLPAHRSIAVDCKAVLTAFLDASSATDEAQRKSHLRRHADLVRARAKDLASKNYWQQFKHAPEFVLLFLPGEAFLYAAAEHDPALIEDCLTMGVILATPTTFIALLKTIELGWRQEQISRNAEEIRTLGVEIYDRLAILGNHVEKLGGTLDGSVKAYNDMVKSLESRLLVSARKIGELGARSDRPIPDLPLIDRVPQELSSVLKPDRSPLL